MSNNVHMSQKTRGQLQTTQACLPKPETQSDKIPSEDFEELARGLVLNLKSVDKNLSPPFWCFDCSITHFGAFRYEEVGRLGRFYSVTKVFLQQDRRVAEGVFVVQRILIGMASHNMWHLSHYSRHAEEDGIWRKRPKGWPHSCLKGPPEEI